jgi:hypothetical protein
MSRAVLDTNVVLAAERSRGHADQLAAQAGADIPRLRALDALQACLALDAGKADAWTAALRDARR